MEYRLVRLGKSDEYVQIFEEEKSELIGSVVREKKWGIFRAYKLRLDNEIYSLSHRILNPRHWRLAPLGSKIKFRWKMLGKGVKVLDNEEVYTAKNLKRGKMDVTNQRKRTGFILDPTRLSSDDMVLLEDYDRLAFPTIVGASILILDRYKLW